MSNYIEDKTFTLWVFAVSSIVWTLAITFRSQGALRDWWEICFFVSSMMIIGCVMEFFSYRKDQRKQLKFLKHILKYGDAQEIHDYQSFLASHPSELELELVQENIVRNRRLQVDLRRTWREKELQKIRDENGRDD